MEEVIWQIHRLCPLVDSGPVFHRSGRPLGRARLITPGRGVTFTSLTPDAPIAEPHDFLSHLAHNLRENGFDIFPGVSEATGRFYPLQILHGRITSHVILASKAGRACFVKVADNSQTEGQIQVIPGEVASYYFGKNSQAARGLLENLRDFEKSRHLTTMEELKKLEHLVHPLSSQRKISWYLVRSLSLAEFKALLKTRRGAFSHDIGKISFRTRFGTLHGQINTRGTIGFIFYEPFQPFSDKHKKEVVGLAKLLKK